MQLRRAMATFKFTGGVIAFQRQADRRHARQRLHARVRRADLQADRRLRQLRLSRKPRRQLRADRLRLVLDEVPPSGRVLRALLNAQPMGFYAPAQIVRDAREHGVEVRPVCVNAVRMGLHAGAGRRRHSGRAARPAHGEGAGRTHGDADRRRRGAAPYSASRMCGAVPACRSPRWNGWPRPTRSSRSASSRRQALWAIRGLRRDRRCRSFVADGDRRPALPRSRRSRCGR